MIFGVKILEAIENADFSKIFRTDEGCVINKQTLPRF